MHTDVTYTKMESDIEDSNLAEKKNIICLKKEEKEKYHLV